MIFFIRLKKKRESDTKKLAFEMAKYYYTTSDEPYEKKFLFAYYLFYLDALENNMLPSQGNYNIMKDFSDDFERKIKRLEMMTEKLSSIKEKFTVVVRLYSIK